MSLINEDRSTSPSQEAQKPDLDSWRLAIYDRALTLFDGIVRQNPLGGAMMTEASMESLVATIQTCRKAENDALTKDPDLPPDEIEREIENIAKALQEYYTPAVLEGLGALEPATKLEWARKQETELDAQVRANISFAYSPEYLEIAATLYDLEPVEFRGLTAKLKGRGIKVTDFERKVRDQLREQKEAKNAQTKAATGSGGGKPESQATRLVKLGQAKCELFHSGDDCFASFEVDSHYETWSLKSRGFKRWLAHEYMTQEGTAPNGEATGAALNTLAGYAQFDAPERPTFVRIAGYDGRIYVDLCDPGWRIIEVDKGGWRIIEPKAAPVRFRRAHGMMALPEPKRGGQIAQLRPFVNVKDDADFMLVVGWLVAALRNHGPYPLLAFYGEQGCAKTTNAKVCRVCIDPNIGLLRSPPKEARDLAIAARNGWIIGHDNISTIPPWLSDALCTLATGGAFSTRTLFADEDEQIFAFQRPGLITDIAESVTEADLIDRGVFITAPIIIKEARKTEEEFWDAFYEAQPRILGALLDGVSRALADVGKITMLEKPRMADFAMWAEAAGPAFGWKPGAFLAAYEDNRAAASSVALQTLLAESIQKMALPWEGTATSLLEELEEQFSVLGDDGKAHTRAKPKNWPATANVLGKELRKISPNLRSVGIAKLDKPGERHIGIDVQLDEPGKRHSRRISISSIFESTNHPESKGEMSPESPDAQKSEKPLETADLFSGRQTGRQNQATELSPNLSPAYSGQESPANSRTFSENGAMGEVGDRSPLLSECGGSQKKQQIETETEHYERIDRERAERDRQALRGSDYVK